MSHTTRSPVEVTQDEPDKLNVKVDNFPIQDYMQNKPHYVQLAHNTTTVVWTPTLGYKIHLVSLVASATAAGALTIYDRTPPATDTIIMVLDFNEKKSVPIPLNTDLDFGYDHVLVALFVGDAGTPSAHLTAIGHEHNPSDFPP